MNDLIKKYKFKESSDLQIEVISLESFILVNKDNLIKPHRTNFYHVFLFENCSPLHYIDFLTIKIEPYSLLFIDKDRVHHFDKFLNYKGRILVFTEDFFSTTKNDTEFLKNTILFNVNSNEATIKLDENSFSKFVRICKNIKEELIVPTDKSKHILLKNLLHNFLLLAEREKKKQGYTELKKGSDLDYTILFRNMLEINFTKLKTVREYSALIFISEKRLGIATKKILGKKPKEIINDRILLEAKRLLIHSNLSIKVIGQNLGFEDPAYFVRYFKNKTETTPVEYRKKYS